MSRIQGSTPGVGLGTSSEVEINIHSIMRAHGKTYDEARDMETGVMAGLIADDVAAGRQPYEPWVCAYRYLTRNRGQE